MKLVPYLIATLLFVGWSLDHLHAHQEITSSRNEISDLSQDLVDAKQSVFKSEVSLQQISDALEDKELNYNRGIPPRWREVEQDPEYAKASDGMKATFMAAWIKDKINSDNRLIDALASQRDTLQDRASTVSSLLDYQIGQNKDLVQKSQAVLDTSSSLEKSQMNSQLQSINDNLKNLAAIQQNASLQASISATSASLSQDLNTSQNNLMQMPIYQPEIIPIVPVIPISYPETHSFTTIHPNGSTSQTYQNY